MGIASGAFVGPSPSRNMTAAQTGQLTHTRGLIDELRQGVPNAYVSLVLAVVVVVLAAALRRLAKRPPSGTRP